jgi:hypothetical protein
MVVHPRVTKKVQLLIDREVAEPEFWKTLGPSVDMLPWQPPRQRFG